MIGHDFRIPIEKPFSNSENVNPAEEDKRKADTKKNSQGEYGFAVSVNDSKKHLLRIVF
jgi:hypothetical protein